MRTVPMGQRLFPVALAVCGCAAALAAQSGPGLPNLTFTASQRYKAVTTIGSGNHGKPMMHDGYLTVMESDPVPGVSFYDISNPYAPVLAQTITGTGADLPEQHTYAQTTAWGGSHVVLTRGWGPIAAGGGTGIAVWDWTDINAPVLRSSYDIPDVPGGYVTGLFWMAVQAPYVFCPAGSLGLYVLDVSDPTSPVVAAHIPKSQTGGFNAVLAFAVGNMLILTNNDAGSGVGPGFARLDISDPTDPQLLYATTNTPSPYGASVNGGHLLVPGVDGTFSVHDLYDPTFPMLGSFSAASTRGASAVAQDGFVHVGATRAYFKMDIRNPSQMVLQGGFSSGIQPHDEDWVTPLGNLVAVADDVGNGTHLVPHQSPPDNVGPVVNMVVPADGATSQALTTRVGLTLTDMVEIASIGSASFVVRPVGGAALTGAYTHQFGVVNFVPDQPLQPSTTYEVVVPAGGMRDWAGNAVPTAFTSRFSTGAQVTAIDVDAQTSAPTRIGESVTFDVASVAGPGPFQYSWDFGDGSPPTAFSASSQVTHSYAAAGHYAALVTVSNGTLTASDSFVHTVHYPLTAARPTRSSTVALDEVAGLVWCANADNDTVTAVDSTTISGVLEVPVGAHPRSLAVAPDGSVWVACQDDATVEVIDPAQGQVVATVALPYASAPYGIAMAPDGSVAYVSLTAVGQVAKLDVTTRSLVATTRVGPDPRGIAISADGERIFVSRFRSSGKVGSDVHRDREKQNGSSGSPGHGHERGLPSAEVYELSAARFARVGVTRLAFDRGPDGEASGRGLPNYLNSLCISPDGRTLWVPSKKDNIARGEMRSGQPLNHENTVRTIVSQVDLTTTRERLGARIDLNNRDMAFATNLSPLGDYAFHALQGSNAVLVTDAYTGALVASVDGTGFAPQGMAMTADGSRLFVHNFMSRSVVGYDTSGLTASVSFAMPRLGSWNLVTNEQLAPDVLLGKRIFYNGADRRMNRDGYISCASCHLDGGHDGMVWDFTDRGEGLRNTTTLRGRAGIAHGNVHWTGNFDEIQDFENDIRGSFGGVGFLSDALWSTTSDPLGSPKAGLSSELDALAAYVGSLASFGLSPHRNSDGTLTAAAVAGKAVFASAGCAQCHAGSAFTDSPQGLRHDVGTATVRSGRASGQAIVGFDTPTLRGLWATAPYLHDGSARNLMEVLTTRNAKGLHGTAASLTPAERRQLVAYLLQIDDLEP